MTKKAETRLQSKIRKRIERDFGGFWRKQWGGRFAGAGLPDLLGYVEAVPFQLEVKLPSKRSKPTVLQLETILKLREAGVVADIITSEEEAVKLVGYWVKEITSGRAVRFSEIGYTLWSREKILSFIDGARNREERRRQRHHARVVKESRRPERIYTLPKKRHTRLGKKTP